MKWLIPFLFLFTAAQADSVTTGNLLPNGTGAASNLQSVDNTIPNVQSSCSSFTSVNTTCTNQNWNYQEVEVGSTSSGTGSLNYTGDLVGVTTGSETTTQNMLDNGITLNSTIEVQNGECSVAGCWGGQGNADTFTITLKIKDSDGNVLATSTKIRTDVTGINGAIFTDRLIYNGTGSSVGNIHLSGSDANAPSTLGGPNLDNISVTMTYDNTVIATEIVEEINNIFEEFEEITFEPMLVIMKEIPLEDIME